MRYLGSKSELDEYLKLYSYNIDPVMAYIGYTMITRGEIFPAAHLHLPYNVIYHFADFVNTKTTPKFRELNSFSSYVNDELYRLVRYLKRNNLLVALQDMSPYPYSNIWWQFGYLELYDQYALVAQSAGAVVPVANDDLAAVQIRKHPTFRLWHASAEDIFNLLFMAADTAPDDTAIFQLIHDLRLSPADRTLRVNIERFNDIIHYIPEECIPQVHDFNTSIHFNTHKYPWS